MPFLKYFSVLVQLVVLFTKSCHSQELSIRLRDGRTPFEGRVEVLIGTHWGTIEDPMSLDAAVTVCRQLGFTAAEEVFEGGVFPPADWTTPVLLRDIQCTGGVNTLSECTYHTVTNQYYTTHNRDAGVRCAVEHSLRLSNIGMLEIQHAGRWTPICNDSWWGEEESAVACRQLGYDRAGIMLDVSNHDAVSLSELNCTGEESRLRYCQSPPTILSICSVGRSIQLQCIGAPISPHPPLANISSCSSISLMWTPPDNRGLLILFYYLRYRPRPQSPTHTTPLLPWRNITNAASDAGTETAIIDDLQPLTEYEFQVSAVNSAGAGPFSDSTTVTTFAPNIGAPGQVQIDVRNKTATEISWTEPEMCGINSLTYEILYSIEGNFLSSVSFRDSISLAPHGNSSLVQYMLQDLLPYTQYSVKVRVVGYMDGGDGMYQLDDKTYRLAGQTLLLTSNYSDITFFVTEESAPSGSPQAFVAFFSILQSTVYFQWQPVPSHLANGIITAYVISCNYLQNGQRQHFEHFVNSTIFTYSLENLVAATQYECAVSAINEIGHGPSSAPILLVTPADLNRRPSAPRNVAFAIETTSDESSFFITASWEMVMCESNFSCVELLGYVIICRDDRSSNRIGDTTGEVRKTLWLSDYASDDDVYDASRIPVRPFTRYECSMSSMNTYGVGQAGSRISVITPPTAPTQSPMQFYFTSLQSDRVRVHWTYNEFPRTGVLNSFAIDTFRQNPRSPELEGTFIIREFLSSITDQEQITFSYQLTELEPGASYNIFVSAVIESDVQEEGPRGRTSFTTLRTVPTLIPESVSASITSSMPPFPVTIQWSLSTFVQHSNHIGFIVHCYDNRTGLADEVVSHSILNDKLLSVYSTSLLFPAECGDKTVTYECTVAAFNERGEGQSSKPEMINLSCNPENTNNLSGSFLADPSYSITFLALVVLLIILLLIALIFCGLCVARYERRVQKEQQYSTVPYDEGYISMAPSGSNSSAVKPLWLRNYPSPGMATRLSTDQEDFGHYDEIPGERTSKTENVYDEIPLRLTPIPPGRSNNSSMRSSPAIQHIVTCPSIRSVSSCQSDKSCELDESQITTMTSITKSDNHSPGTIKLSTLSSDESLAKATEMKSGVEKTLSSKHNPRSIAREGKSGYVEVVTTKDGKRSIRELDRPLPKIPSTAKREMDTVQRRLVRGKSAERAPIQDHSYQNVAEIKRPKSASSARVIGVVDSSCKSTSSMIKVTSADFKLSTVTDSDV